MIPLPVVILVVVVILLTRNRSQRPRFGRHGALAPDDDSRAQIDMLESRVAELEERLDFAERLLARPEVQDSLH